VLRITTQDDTEGLTFRLEGRVAGPWVTELCNCWKGTLSRPPTVRVDLRSVTFVDAAGKALLAEMVRHGAKLLANDCLMKAIVAEIETAASDP
jgi:ABC-type transporter Mla MlaB component